MKTTLVLVICTLFFGVGWIFGQQTRPTQNGQEWKKLGVIDPLARTSYVMGFRDGYQDGVRDVHGLTLTLSLEEMKSVWGDATPIVPGVQEVSGTGAIAGTRGPRASSPCDSVAS